MPELPDVEIYKKYFEVKGLKHKVKSIEVRSSLTLGKSRKDLHELQNGAFASVQRYGKYLFATSTNGVTVAMHFGMTGFLYDFTDDNPYDNHSRVLFHLDNHHTLAFVDTRLLGRVTVIDSIESFIKKKRLGPDALNISLALFEKILKGRGNVKSALIDQHKMAGVGNIFADEVLFQAKIHPKTPLSKLTKQHLKTLYKQMRKVLLQAVKAHADIDEMPRNWILPRRKKGDSCPKCKNAIQKITVAGRPTYFCPHCQR